jgi:hypothetical protein
MRGAIGLHRPTRQQQSQNHAKNELFLLGKANHGNILAEQWRYGNHCLWWVERRRKPAFAGVPMVYRGHIPQILI